ncbi:MAG: hypothetical protein ACQEP8_05805 [Chlamydiota bacterium]
MIGKLVVKLTVLLCAIFFTGCSKTSDSHQSDVSEIEKPKFSIEDLTFGSCSNNDRFFGILEDDDEIERFRKKVS